MPTYFFDTKIDGKSSPDEDGVDLPDLAHARSEARVALCELTAELDAGFSGTSAELRVRDHAGDILLVMSLELKVALPCRLPDQ